MARTVFVNPSRKRRRRRAKRRNFSAAMANPRKRRSRRRRRRNAGIAPFVKNPLIMSNPRRRRRRRSNPLTSALTLNNMVNKGLTFGGGALIAVGANTLAINAIDNFWARNGVRFGAGVVAAAFLKGDLGAATAGALFYPMFQEIASKVLTPKTTSPQEADMDVLAADLEDVMNELDHADLSDGDDYEADSDDLEADLEASLEDDTDDILG